MKYIVFYKNFDAVVESYDEAEDVLTNQFGYWDPDYVEFDEYDEETM